MPSTSLFRISGSHRTCGHAHLFAQPRTRRISQFYGLNRPNGSSISPLRCRHQSARPRRVFPENFASCVPHSVARTCVVVCSRSRDGHPFEQLLVPGSKVTVNLRHLFAQMRPYRAVGTQSKQCRSDFRETFASCGLAHAAPKPLRGPGSCGLRGWAPAPTALGSS